jgi:hypothetical protein
MGWARSSGVRSNIAKVAAVAALIAMASSSYLRMVVPQWILIAQ